jgi:PAS domain S-box-containing protein
VSNISDGNARATAFDPSIVDGLRDGILVVDEHGILYSNTSAKRLLGDPLPEKLPFEIAVGTAQDLNPPCGDRARTVEVRAAETRWHERSAILVTLHDVTSQRAVEASLELDEERLEALLALRRANEALGAEIEQRKRVEAALRSSEERYELATSAGLVGLWDLDLETKEMYVDPKLKAMLGYTDGEIRDHQDDWRRYVHPEDAPLVSAAFETYLAGERDCFEVAHRMVHGQDDVRWFLARGRAIRDNTGKPTRIIGTDTDITDRKSMEATIVAQNDFLNGVIEALSHPLYVIDVDDHTIRLANSAAVKAGIRLGSTCNGAAQGSETPCRAGLGRCPLGVVCETGRPATMEHVHLDVDGKQRVYEIHGYPLFDSNGNVKQMIEYTLEITERKRVERERGRRNRELLLLNSIITASTTEGGPDAVLTAACRGLKEAFELHRVTAVLFDVGEGKARIVAEDADADAVLGTGRILQVKEICPARLLEAGEPMMVEDVRVPTVQADFRDLFLERGVVAAALVPLSLQGEQVGIFCLEHDRPKRFDDGEVELAMRVADQVIGSLVRERLYATRRRLETAIEQAADAIVLTDKHGTITYVNPAFERITGFGRNEAIGRKPSILKSGRHDQAFYAQLWDTILAGNIWRGRMVNRSKSGALFVEDAVIAPVRDESDHTVGFIASKRDVTRELELEEHVRQAQKMDSIGRLAGGVAHDFNNLLAVILGYAGLALGNLTPNDSVYDSIKEIEETTQRAAAVTRQLLTFARRQVTEPRSLDLRDILANLDRMLERLIGPNIELKLVAPPDLWRVRVDGGQLEQVVVNLAINARDAMPQGGRLLLHLANTQVAPGAPVHEGVQPGQYVELLVHDTGVGMTDEVKRHIFEPFFTTKDREQGTGLGLATCFGIVTQSEGHIWVESTLGEGTTVRVLIPRTGEVDHAGATELADEHMPRGRETVFIVEDEDQLRRIACHVLRKLGYCVLEAEDGEAALRVAEARIGEVDLLVTDVVMPQMSGPELVRRLQVWKPNLPVIFTSGYARDTSALRADAPDARLLDKPFTLASLANAVREALDAR